MNTRPEARGSRQESSLLRRGLALFPLVALLALLVLHDRPVMDDELEHYAQLLRFIEGDWSQQPTLTTIPGYHALIAALAMVTGWSSINAARFFTLLFSLCAVGVFYLLAKEIRGPFAATRSLQFAFMPLLFPFFLLMYTDSTSILCILSMMYFTLRGRYQLGGLAGLVSCLIRQNNVVWVMFMLLLSYVDEHGWTWPCWRDWRSLLGRYWLFLLTGLLFAVFVAVNGGVSIGDAEAHPLSRIYVTNIFFLLFLTFFLFLPALWARRREMRTLLQQRETWPVVAALFFAYWFGFTADHPYNVNYGDYFLRNAILIFFTSSGFLKILFFIPVALAALWLWVAPLRRNWWLLYPFTVLVLLPAWLIEQRYYLIPLSFFLLAREPESAAVEYVQLGLFVIMTALIFFVIERAWWFL